MRIIRRRNRRDPKLRVSTIAKVTRREAAMEKLRARPDSTLNSILIAAKLREIQELIRIDHELFDAGVGSLRAKTFARLRAKPDKVDRRTREYKRRNQESSHDRLQQVSGPNANMDSGDRGEVGQERLDANRSGTVGHGGVLQGVEATRPDDRAQMPAESAVDSQESLDAIRAAIRADAADLALDSVP